MAAPKKIVEPKVIDFSKDIIKLNSRLADLEQFKIVVEDTLLELQKIKEVVKAPSINRVEAFNDEQPSTIDSYNGMQMTEDDKIISMRNAIKILPPNMVVDGRHSKINVEAICGFKILDEQMDEAYKGITHES